MIQITEIFRFINYLLSKDQIISIAVAVVCSITLISDNFDSDSNSERLFDCEKLSVSEHILNYSIRRYT